MNKTGHLIFGGALTVSAGVAALPYLDEQTVILAGVASLIGTTAPDTLEVRFFYGNGGSTTLIKHRTVTHYLPLWLGILALGIWVAMNQNLPVGTAIAGFAFGSLTHLLGDMMTPMGIPLWHPFKHRTSLHLIDSGFSKFLVLATTIALSALFVSQKVSAEEVASPIYSGADVASAGRTAVQNGGQTPPADNTQPKQPTRPAQGYSDADKRCLDKDGTECGWFWGYIDKDKKPEEKKVWILPPKTAQQAEEPEDEEKRCIDRETWTVDCGFRDPKGNWDFQVKQRDEIFKDATMNPKDTKAVEALQYYHKWVTKQAALMARMWEFNMMQNTELNPFAAAPVTSFGYKALNRARKAHNESVFEDIKDQGGFLVWFTRESCGFCADMIRPMEQLGNRTGLEVWNASLEDTCMPGYENKCLTKEFTVEPAKILKVTMVPDLFLHLPEDRVWIRVASGLDSAQTIMRRIEMFATAVKSAVAKGLVNASKNGKPAVDFDRDFVDRTMNAMGAAPGVSSEE